MQLDILIGGVWLNPPISLENSRRFLGPDLSITFLKFSMSAPLLWSDDSVFGRPMKGLGIRRLPERDRT